MTKDIGERMVEVAKACLDTPFVHQGRVPGVGLDCAGLLVHCLATLGIEHTDADGYPRMPYDGQLESAFASQPSLEPIFLGEQPLIGDILILRVTKAPQHITLLSQYRYGHPYIIHASEIHGKVVEHRLDQFERAKILRQYRVRG